MLFSRKALAGLGIRLAISAALIGLVLLGLRTEAAELELWPGTGHVLAAFSFWLGAVAVLALRLRRLSGELAPGRPLSLGYSVRLTFEGHSLGQISPGLIGGDIWRSVRLTRHGLTAGAAVQTIVLDRLIGLYGLGVPAFFAALWSAFSTGRHGLAIGLIAAVLAAHAILWLFVVRPPKTPGIARLRTFLRLQAVEVLFKNGGDALAVMVVLAIIGHLSSIAAFLTIGSGIGLTAPLAQSVFILSVALFLAAMPVAFGGWGAREAAVAAGFLGAGIDPALPVATSIAYGLLLLAACAPGLILLMLPVGNPSRT
jgi:hypothetical protein